MNDREKTIHAQKAQMFHEEWRAAKREPKTVKIKGETKYIYIIYSNIPTNSQERQHLFD